MKAARSVKISYVALTVILSIVVAYNACTRAQFMKVNGTSVFGNPMAPVSNDIIFAVCGVINRCNPQVTLNKCQAAVLSTPGFSAPLGLPSNFDTMSAVTLGEQSGSLTGNLSAGNVCYDTINALTCADPQVTAAYNASSPNPFAGTPQLLTSSSCGQAFAANVIYAASPSYADVSAAVAAASSGYMVIVPPGTATWNSTLTINKGIILKGAGIGQTVITSNTQNVDSGYLISYAPADPSLNEPFELSGFTFDGAMDVNPPGSGILTISSNSNTVAITKIKIHDNKFQNASLHAIDLAGLEFGVIYNNQFQDNNVSIYAGHVEQNGWNYPVTQGGANYPFIEDNTFTQTIARGGFIADSSHGGRLVFRHNSISGYGGNGGEVWTVQGAVSLPANTGSVSTEFYDNNISLSATARILNDGGGKAMMFNNTVTGGANNYVSLTEYQGWSYCTTAPYPKPEQVNATFYWNNPSNGADLAASYICPSSNPSCTSCNPKQFDDTYIQLNRDYWTPQAGLDADKPSTCSLNSYYGARDTGALYFCNPANTWVLQYAPFTYPHPLR